MKTKHQLLFMFLFCSYHFCCGQEVKKEYDQLLEEIAIERAQYQLDFTAADSLKKGVVIAKARKYLIAKIANELFPYWYGTKWDFNGTTRVPQKGNIACGYFVTNTLTDVGFDIPRIQWAQSASEVFIKKLAPQSIKRFSEKPINTVIESLLIWGNGLYLVGLDSHTGYIYVNDGKVRFIHADYYEPEKGVVSEKLDSYSPINDSHYRVIGKLMSDDMIVHWIEKKAIR